METALYCKQTGSKEQSIITYLVKKKLFHIIFKIKEKVVVYWAEMSLWYD